MAQRERHTAENGAIVSKAVSTLEEPRQRSEPTLTSASRRQRRAQYLGLVSEEFSSDSTKSSTHSSAADSPSPLSSSSFSPGCQGMPKQRARGGRRPSSCRVGSSANAAGRVATRSSDECMFMEEYPLSNRSNDGPTAATRLQDCSIEYLRGNRGLNQRQKTIQPLLCCPRHPLSSHRYRRPGRSG